MVRNKKRHYFRNANKLGWGPKTASLNIERISLLNKYIVGNKVLDIGCGTGIYVNYLARKDKKATGIDFVKEFISYAKKHYKGSFLVANAYRLPFKKKSFDTVIMFDILEHLENEQKVLKEAKRVAKKRIIAIVPKETEKTLEATGLVFRHHLDRSHRRTYSIKRIKDNLNKADIQVILIKLLNRIPNETLLNILVKKKSFFKRFIIKLLFWLFKKEDFFSDIAIVGRFK